METQLHSVRARMLADLRREGFCLCPRLSPELTTFQVANALGKIIQISEILPGTGIPAIQTLTPRLINGASASQYSGNYGLGIFPLHTDLAHWAVPPRYFILRCIVGSTDVFTHLLPRTDIVQSVGASTIRRAVFSARKRRVGYSGLFRAMSEQEGTELFRWDPIFLLPFNSHAEQMASVISNSNWSQNMLKFLLKDMGDTIVIDNWRNLHGRATVPVGSVTRLIERAYLSEVLE